MGEYLDVLMPLALIILVVVAFVVFGPTVFVIVIRESEVSVRRGQVPRQFLDAVEDISSSVGIAKGKITGVRQGDRIRLRFSRSIPARIHQRLRNAWNLSL